jgi:glycosyltransferase involved in cell wall biosynthesis
MKDKRIRAYKNDTNLRLVFTRNKGLTYVDTASRYVGILDADDTVSPGWLEASVQYLDRNTTVSVV